ncbi:MAG: hypothetical protein IT381_01655 [Deltaproteobacteria bacterium]|nr:hypothetical protein [Deltaproteobacteria bacterium]
MNIQQELDSTLKELELAKAGLKTAGGDAQQRSKMESKLHWLEQKVEKLRKKSQS